MLINCAECGKQISDTVEKCPHCGGNPKSVRCTLCGNFLPESRAKENTYFGINKFSQPYRIEKVFYHPECIERFKSEYLNLSGLKIACPECHRDLSNAINQDGLLPRALRSSSTALEVPESCPSCGYRRIFEEYRSGLKYPAQCSKCHLPVYRGLHSYCEAWMRYYDRVREQFSTKDEATLAASRHHPLCTTGFEEEHPEWRYKYFSKLNEQIKEVPPKKKAAPPFKGDRGCSVILAVSLLISVLLTIFFIAAA